MSQQYLFHVDPPAVADPGDELSIQTRFRSRITMLAPSILLVATPNAGKRSHWEARKAKQEGMVSGWPDLTAYWSNGESINAVPGNAFLEFKARKGVLSEAQISRLNWLHRNGFPCGVFRSVETAIEFLRRTGAPFLFHKDAA